MYESANAAIAFVAAYVMSEPVATVICTRLHWPPWCRHALWGGLAGLAAFIFAGTASAWPVAILLGGLAAAVSLVDMGRAGALRWLALHTLAFGAIMSLAVWGLPLVGAWFTDGATDAGDRGWWPDGFYTVLLVTAGGILTVEWGCPIVERAIRPFAHAMAAQAREEPGLPSGGRMIGRLERLVIYLFILADAPTAIGFLVTAKSILRFGEIKDREMQRVAEYIIIGTLMSFSYALIAGYLTRLAIASSGRIHLLEMLAF